MIKLRNHPNKEFSIKEGYFEKQIQFDPEDDILLSKGISFEAKTYSWDKGENKRNVVYTTKFNDVQQ